MNPQRESPPRLDTESGPERCAGTARSNYNPADRLLARLDGVRQTGPNTWMAKSPCRDDRTASVSIKRVEDRLLIHDFGGNRPDEIMRAVGLTVADLFDKPLNHFDSPLSSFQRKRHDQAKDALQALKHECCVVGVLAEKMAAGFALDSSERGRLKVAIRRVANAQEIAG